MIEPAGRTRHAALRSGALWAVILFALGLGSSNAASAGEAEAATHPPVSLPSPDATASQRDAWNRLVHAGMDADMRGRHDEADAVWDRLEAMDPADAEPWLRRVDTLYWRHWYDESQQLTQDALRRVLDQSRALAEAALEIDEDDQRARWLLGETLMQQARLEAMSGSYVKAGSTGERGRKELERLLSVDPDHAQARYPLGLYYYFSSMMPDFVQSLSWLWFVPKGDRDKGLSLLEEVHHGPSVYSPSATMVLVAINNYHDPTDVQTALRLADQLHTAYPENAILHFELLEVLLHAGRYDRLTDEALALEGRLGESDGVTGRAMLARIWRARAALDLGNEEQAREIVFDMRDDDPRLPAWGRTWLWVVRGNVLDVVGDRAAAVAAYERVLAFPRNDFYSERPVKIASAGLEAPYQPGGSLDGPALRSRD